MANGRLSNIYSTESDLFLKFRFAWFSVLEEVYFSLFLDGVSTNYKCAL